MRNFKNYEVWQSSVELSVGIYRLVKKFPKDEKYGLSSQLKRAAVSIPSNIAEGCSRSSEKEFKKFIEYSIGSSFELETQLIIASRINIICDESIEALLIDLNTIQKKLNALRSKLI